VNFFLFIRFKILLPASQDAIKYAGKGDRSWCLSCYLLSLTKRN